MNRETTKLFEYMVDNPEWLNKLKDKRAKYPNYKDFYNQAGYVIMELLNTEKKFFDYPRKEIQIKKIADLYF